MSEARDLLQAAKYAQDTERNQNRTILLMRELIDRYPDSKEADSARAFFVKLQDSEQYRIRQAEEKSGKALKLLNAVFVVNNIFWFLIVGVPVLVLLFFMFVLFIAPG